MLNSKSYALYVALLLGYSAIEWMSCTKDVANPCEATYESDVNAIVLNTCAYAGCHSGPTASPYVPAIAKDYTSYKGMMETVENGMFRERALELQTMPPVAFVPPGKPIALTSDEISTLKCWLDNGHPEK
jgi:hypothetical protein